MHYFGQAFMGAYLFLIVLLSLYGIHRYWILYLYFRYYKWAKPYVLPAPQNPLPRVTVQLPIYNERYVVERLIDAICGLNYPGDRLEIQVLDDSTDDTEAITRAKVKAMQVRGFNIVHIRRSERMGFKAGALAAGLSKASGMFL